MSAKLFLIFINDLLENRFIGKPCAFTDDIALFYTQENSLYNQLWTSVSKDLITLRNWCASNRMKVNVNETKYMNFNFKGFNFEKDSKFHKIQCPEVNCNCRVIEKVDQYRYLGVILDDKLAWDKHISFLGNKLKSATRTFYFLNNICNQHLMRSLYFALIHSRLQYAIHCWGGSFKYNTDK